MDTIVYVGLIAIIVIGIAVGVLFAIPKTRPYVKKWWPVAVIVGGTIVVALLFRRKPITNRDSPTEITDLDRAIRDAENQLVEAQIRAEVADTAADAREQAVHEELDNINQIEDPYARHAAKKRLLDRVRGNE